jgi:hypothetical protein
VVSLAMIGISLGIVVVAGAVIFAMAKLII